MLRHQGRRLTAAMVTAALLAGFLAVKVTAAAEVQPEEQEDPREKVVEKNVHGLTVDGSFRYLYGQGHFEGKSLAPVPGRGYAMTPFKQLMIMQTLRTRLYANYHFDKNWKFITGVEDNRVLNDQSLTDTAHIFRFFAEGTYPHAKYRAGRFGYKVEDGNTLDTTVDGIRVGFGPEEKRASVFWGRLGSSFNRREGVIVDAYREWDKWYATASYFNFRNHAHDAGDWNTQEVFSESLNYKFTPDISTGIEFLQASGSDRNEDVGHDHGFVWALRYKNYDYHKPGTYRIQLRYYREPAAAVITHTMNAWPGYFRHMGFEGAGACFEYVLFKGGLLTVEGYDLCNYRDQQYLSDFRQKVLGATLTLGF
jgi:hypothetical protein